MKRSWMTGGCLLAGFTLAAAQASAQTLDFEDIPGASGGVGATLTSGGVDLLMQDYLWPGGTVFSGGTAAVDTFPVTVIGSGNMLYPNNINVLFDFAGTIGQQSQVSIDYADLGGNVNFHVNPSAGGAIINANDFSDPAINGATINGVAVSVTSTTGVGSDNWGTITLTGPVDQVLIGGQESFFDDVRAIPEPGSLALLGLGGFVLARRRR
ncbi:MAG: PEP-CTERM sorting domain-containing protein [Planctomycetota bacterium]